jgi:hypothetical protein
VIAWPTPPTGSSEEASFFRRLVDCCKRSVVKVGPGLLLDERQDGLFIRLNSATQSSSAGVRFQDFVFVSDLGDAYSCLAISGAGAVGVFPIKVAKHQDIRCIAFPAGGGWAQKTIRGILYTYTYNQVVVNGVVTEYTRSVVSNENPPSVETNYITPALMPGDIITAFLVSTNYGGLLTLAGVTWQALADGRAWSKK